MHIYRKHQLGMLIIGLLLMGLFVDVSVSRAADTSYYATLRNQNDGHLAEKMRFIPTTDSAVVYTFGGLSRASSLDDILQRLDENGMRATFFVTERELQRNSANIDKIVAHGQELGIGLRPAENDGYFEDCAQIDRIRTTLANRYGIQANAVRQMFGPESDELREAVSAMGCILIGQGLNVVQSKHKDAMSVADVMPSIFGKWTTSLNRGEVVYIRTDFYTNETLAGDMMMAIKKDKVDNIAYSTYDDIPGLNPSNDSAYRIASVGDVWNRSDLRYDYPVDMSLLPEPLQPDYRSYKVDDNNFDHEFLKRYIGSPEVDENDRMLGFSRDEMAKADKTGVVKSVLDNTIFLTFDDWGNDRSINKLLYVLRKHHVTGTFFIITRTVPNNPNLLRAIALEGNEIGSHTDQHKAMATRDAHNRQVPVETDAQYTVDVNAAYAKLAAAIGDVTVAGRPALTRLMRPPTLAISKFGAKAIMNAGYDYMVSGYESTEDYGAVSLQALIGTMQAGIYDQKGNVRRGSILVMHMSDTANYTPRALDIMLTENENRADNDPKKFKVGHLSDYLKDDYSQMMKQLTPEEAAGAEAKAKAKAADEARAAAQSK